MEGGLFVEDEFGRVASVDPLVTVGAEEGVGLVAGGEVGKVHTAAAVVADEPGVGRLATLEDGLKGEGHGAALGIVGKDVAPCGIGDELCHGAASARHVPG